MNWHFYCWQSISRLSILLAITLTKDNFISAEPMPLNGTHSPSRLSLSLSDLALITLMALMAVALMSLMPVLTPPVFRHLTFNWHCICCVCYGVMVCTKTVKQRSTASHHHWLWVNESMKQLPTKLVLSVHSHGDSQHWQHCQHARVSECLSVRRIALPGSVILFSLSLSVRYCLSCVPHNSVHHSLTIH